MGTATNLDLVLFLLPLEPPYIAMLNTTLTDTSYVLFTGALSMLLRAGHCVPTAVPCPQRDQNVEKGANRADKDEAENLRAAFECAPSARQLLRSWRLPFLRSSQIMQEHHHRSCKSTMHGKRMTRSGCPSVQADRGLQNHELKIEHYSCCSSAHGQVLCPAFIVWFNAMV